MNELRSLSRALRTSQVDGQREKGVEAQEEGGVPWAAPLCCVGEGEWRKAGGEMEKTNLDHETSHTILLGVLHVAPLCEPPPW